MSTHYWRHLPGETQNTLVEIQIETVCECAKEIAHEQLDDMLPEELGWIAVMATDGDPEEPGVLEGWVRRHFPDYVPDVVF